MLDEGRYGSITEMAAAERIERGYLGSLLRLTLLAPELIEEMLEGQRRETITLQALLEAFPARWDHQAQRRWPVMKTGLPAAAP
jgi:hypothetical protein